MIINDTPKEQPSRAIKIIYPEPPKYEYEILNLGVGLEVYQSDLTRLGFDGYRLVGIVPITMLEYAGDLPVSRSNGSQLIFERVKKLQGEINAT